DDLIERYERETKRHELNDRSQADHCRADTKAGESVLADGCVDDAFRPEALKQPSAHLVRSLILGHFFPHQDNAGIGFELFCEGFVQRLAICDFSHAFAPLKYT